MKKIRSTAALAGVMAMLAPLSGFAASASDRAILLPNGTPVNVQLTSRLSSNSAHQGDTFMFRVLRDVRSAGQLVIAAGATGTGEIASAQSAADSEPGRLELKFDFVSSVDGRKIALNPTVVTSEGAFISGAASHKWAHGHEAFVTPKAAFTASVDNTAGVDAPAK